MKIPVSLSCISLLVYGGMLCGFVPNATARNAASGTSLVEARLAGDTILSSSREKLVAAVRDSVKQNPLKAGKIVQAVLGGGRADADAIAPQVTAAAIEGLGQNPGTVSVSEVVYYAVKATPAVVLDTVKAAVKASPSSAKTIVRAAVKAIPNPNAKIAPIAENLNDNPVAGYAKDEKDSKDDKDVQESTAEPLPIGEAIANAAFQADPSQSLQELLAAANQAARDPGFTTVSTYGGYYYPPLLSGGPSPTPNPPPVVPTPPVVSQ